MHLRERVASPEASLQAAAVTREQREDRRLVRLIALLGSPGMSAIMTRTHLILWTTAAQVALGWKTGGSTPRSLVKVHSGDRSPARPGGETTRTALAAPGRVTR